MPEETTTRERSTTTALMMTEMTYEQLVESQLTKLLYLIHGTGSDRDRTIQLSTLRKWILEGVSNADFDNLTVSTKIAMNGDPASTEITKGHVNVKTATSTVDMYTSGLSVDGTVGQVVKKTIVEDDNVTVTGGNNVSALTKLGLNVTDGIKTLNVSRTSVSITEGNDSLTLDKNGLSGSVGGNAVLIGKDRVETAQFRVTSIVDVTTTYYDGLSRQEQLSGNPKVGDIVQVWNKGTKGVKVYLNHTTGGGSSTYVTINAGCCIPFICVYAASAQVYSDWAPQANLQIYNES